MAKHPASRTAVLILLMLIFTAGIGLSISPAQAQILGTDWTGDFYNNTNLSGSPVAVGIDYPNGLNFNWANGQPTDSNSQPIPGIDADNFSVVFTSTQSYAQTGNYLFTLRFNDGLRLYVNGGLVYDQFTELTTPDPDGTCVGLCHEAQILLPLNAGDVALRVEYVEFTGDALLQVQWGLTSLPGATLTPAPDNELIYNGGFEGYLVGDYDSGLDYWGVPTTQWRFPPCNNLVTGKIIAYTGDCAYRSVGSLDSDSRITQKVELYNVTFASGDSLDFSFWMKAKNEATAGTAKVIVRYSDDTAPTRITVDLVQAADYTEMTGNATIASAAVSKIKVVFSNRSPSGKVFIDQISLLLVSSGSGINQRIVPLPLSPASESELTGRGTK